MSQEALDFGRLYLVDEEHRSAWRAVESAAHAVTMVIAAGASGLEQPDLTRTFQPNSGRHLRLKTAMAIGAVAGPDARREILAPVARLFGLSIAEAAPPMTDRERADIAESVIDALGPIAKHALLEAFNRRRR